MTRHLVPLPQRAASRTGGTERRVQVLENRVNSLAASLQPGTWYPITLDAGWVTDAGYAVPSYMVDAQGNLHLTGLADFGSSQTVNHNLNSGSPLPSAPPTTKLFRSWDGQGERATVQISAGVIEALGTSTYPYRYAEIDAVFPLGL